MKNICKCWKNRMRGIRRAAFLVLGMFLFCSYGWAFINPNFTPVDIVKQSDLVLLLDFKSVDKEGKVTATIQKVLKGETKDKEIVLNIDYALIDAQGKDFIERVNAGQKQAIFFIGIFQVENVGVEGLGEKSVGFLHFADKSADWQWVGFKQVENKSWDMEKVESYLLGTWAGGTDMLLRAVNYIVSDPDATVPSVVGAEWGGKLQIGKVAGKVNSLMAVDILDNGKPDIFLTGEKGDRLFRYNGKTVDDITAKTALNTSSAVYAWGDLNGDGKIDLASWSGKELNILFQKMDGTFERKVIKTESALLAGCMTLAVLDSGAKDKPVLLAGTKSSPVLLFLQGDGTVKTEVLADGKAGNDFGEGGRCLLADFDGDGIIDILQLFEQGGLLYKGKGLVKFSAPVQAEIETGKGCTSVCTGDYDADGLTDVFTTGEGKCKLLANFGGGKFVNMMALGGEIYYIAKDDSTDSLTGDFNNDGRQDILISYLNIGNQLFFNRGFRSFGHGREMNTDEKVPVAAEGQQKSCAMDINGDGAEDLAVVLKNGEFWLFTRKVDGKALSFTAGLSPSGAFTGPLNITMWRDKRCFGAWTVTAGDAGAFVGLPDAGPVTVKWMLPDGKQVEKEFVVKNGPVRIILNKSK